MMQPCRLLHVEEQRKPRALCFVSAQWLGPRATLRSSSEKRCGQRSKHFSGAMRGRRASSFRVAFGSSRLALNPTDTTRRVSRSRMSALPPKADMCTATRDVRFGPKADIAQLFNHFIGCVEQRLRHGEAKRFRGLEVDYQLELDGGLDGKLTCFRALEN